MALVNREAADQEAPHRALTESMASLASVVILVAEAAVVSIW